MKIERLLLLPVLAMLLIPSAALAQQKPSATPASTQQKTSSAASSAQSPSAASATSAIQWRRTEKDDPSRSRTLIQFTLRGTFVKPPRAQASNRPAILVSCTPNERDASEGRFENAQILVGSPVKIDYVEPLQLTTGNSYNLKVTVQLRIDDEKDRERQWPAGADKSSASIPKDAVKEMLRAHAVVMTVHEKDAGDVEMHFDMPDPSQVEKACDIPR
jgi:hypothetical protein